MKLLTLVIPVFSMCASSPLSTIWQLPNTTGPTFPRSPIQNLRFHREVYLQDSNNMDREEPVLNDGGTKPHAFTSGGFNISPAGDIQPVLGIQAERIFPQNRVSILVFVEVRPGPETVVSIGTQYRLLIGTNPQYAIAATFSSPLSGPDSLPTVKLGYQHKIYEGNRISVGAAGGVSKYLNRSAVPYVQFRGRFRRVSESDMHESTVLYEEGERLKFGDDLELMSKEYEDSIREK